MTNSTQAVPASNAIVSFVFEGHEVRGFEYDGEPYFVGNEVAAALGYASPKNAVSDHCKSLKLLKSTDLALLGIPCGPRGMNIIPERDVYRLVMRSNLPTAEAFEEKVVGEILPSIRKTGGYMVAAKEETPEELALRAVTVLQATLERQREEARFEIERQKALIDEAVPKVAVHDRIYRAFGSLNITEAAKALQLGPKFLFKWLSTNEWTYRRAGGKSWLGYQKRITAGYLEHKVTPLSQEDGTEKLSEQVRVTAKGLTKLAGIVPCANLDPDLVPSDPKGPAPRPFAKKQELTS